jgi:hypothetical protein
MAGCVQGIQGAWTHSSPVARQPRQAQNTTAGTLPWRARCSWPAWQTTRNPQQLRERRRRRRQRRHRHSHTTTTTISKLLLLLLLGGAAAVMLAKPAAARPQEPGAHLASSGGLGHVSHAAQRLHVVGVVKSRVQAQRIGLVTCKHECVIMHVCTICVSLQVRMTKHAAQITVHR